MLDSIQGESRIRKWVALGLIAAVAICGQLLFSAYVSPRATLAGANGISASFGLANGHGMTIAPSEGIAIKRADPSADLRLLSGSDDERMPLIEPLPGLVLIYFLIGLTGYPMTLFSLAAINALVIAVGSMALAAELMKRRFALGALAGFALAAFVPLYRLSMSVGYDMFEFLFVLAAVVCLLGFQRTSDRMWLFANGLCLGLGLWIRSYFFLYTLAHGCVVLILVFRRSDLPRSVLTWAAPIVLLAAGMISVRDAGSTGTLLTRGAFWHTFWMGVGQFENDQIEGITDWDACDLAAKVGYRISCDRTYTDERSPYLFQYRVDYNAALGVHGRAWIPDNIPRLALNTLARLSWLAVPGFADSTRLDASPVVKTLVVLISLIIFFLAMIGIMSNVRKATEEGFILLATYLALIPLTPYYIIAKVVMVAYFCVLVFATAGILAVWDRISTPSNQSTNR
jgi:hypothetical protein